MAEVRATLLKTLEDLSSGRMEPAKAKAIANVAQTLTNTYTLQVRAINALGASGEQFLSELAGEALPAARPMKQLPSPKPNHGTPPDEGIHAADPLRAPRRPEPVRR